jgi:thiol-disulfide isomerase/thioredoxin
MKYNIWLIYMILIYFSLVPLACNHLRPSILSNHLGQTMSPKRVDTLSGKYITIPQVQRLTLIDFWATYCKPCHTQLPALKKLYQTYHKRGLIIIGVSENSNPIKVEKYVQRYQIPWPIVIDGQHKTFISRYDIHILPRLILIDPLGKIIQVRGGEVGAIEALQQSIELYLPKL